jgi:hypothetical protein
VNLDAIVAGHRKAFPPPAQRHGGQDRRLLNARAVYHDARKGNHAALEWADPQLGTDSRRHPQSRARRRRPGGNVTNPTFRFDRRACFPVPTLGNHSTACNAGDGGRAATRSHAQRSEHGEDGEHRTFPAVSTLAHSPLSEVHPSNGFVGRGSHYVV